MAINPNPNFIDPEIEEALAPDPNNPEEFEKFNAPPAGHSLTDEPGKWPWENPPQYADPKEAMDFIIQKAEEPDNEENFLRLLLSGVPVEAIVNTITFAGFTGGFFSVDVAETLKTPIALHFIGLAMENNIPAQVYNLDPEEKREAGFIPQDEVLINMKENRPDMYEAIIGSTEELLDTEINEEGEQESMMNMEDKEEEAPEGFMEMEEEEV